MGMKHRYQTTVCLILKCLLAESSHQPLINIGHRTNASGKHQCLGTCFLLLFHQHCKPLKTLIIVGSAVFDVQEDVGTIWQHSLDADVSRRQVEGGHDVTQDCWRHGGSQAETSSGWQHAANGDGFLKGRSEVGTPMQNI